MKFRNPFFYSGAAAFAMFFSTFCSAQGTIKVVDDSTGLRSYSALGGDTLLITYDSAFVLNKKTYKLYKENYTRVQNKDLSTKKLIESYEQFVAFKDSTKKAQEDYYQRLKSNFDSFSSTATTFVDRTDGNVNAISTSLTNVTNNINNIKSLLDDSLSKLQQVNKKKWQMAVGGFTVGIGVSALIFLITK